MRNGRIIDEGRSVPHSSPARGRARSTTAVGGISSASEGVVDARTVGKGDEARGADISEAVSADEVVRDPSHESESRRRLHVHRNSQDKVSSSGREAVRSSSSSQPQEISNSEGPQGTEAPSSKAELSRRK